MEKAAKRPFGIIALSVFYLLQGVVFTVCTVDSYVRDISGIEIYNPSFAEIALNTLFAGYIYLGIAVLFYSRVVYYITCVIASLFLLFATLNLTIFLSDERMWYEHSFNLLASLVSVLILGYASKKSTRALFFSGVKDRSFSTSAFAG